MSENNPLKQYFRKPGIWIKLPSQGQYYDSKPADFNIMGEIAVFPMTAKDELLMKNADALLNGTAITQLLNSCVPSIVSVDSMPAIDLDVVLLAIRRCTYGEDLDIQTQCPECNANNDSVLNLNHFIAGITTIDNIEPIELTDGIKIFIKPVNVKQLLNLNWVQYEQVRNIQLTDREGMDEKEKVNILQKSYHILTDQNISIISACIDTVLLPDGGNVTDHGNIKEWVEQISQPEFKKIENGIMSLAEKGMRKKFEVKCQNCSSEYQSSLDLNPTTFFA